MNPQRIFDNGSCRFHRSCLQGQNEARKNKPDLNDFATKFIALLQRTPGVQPKPSWQASTTTKNFETTGLRLERWGSSSRETCANP